MYSLAVLQKVGEFIREARIITVGQGKVPLKFCVFTGAWEETEGMTGTRMTGTNIPKHEL